MNKKKIYKILFITAILLFPAFNLHAQCNDTLVDMAILQSGSDAIFIKEFKVKFKKGKTNRPAKVAKYPVYLKDSTNYRFNVLNAKEFDGKVILQLFRNGKLLGSTYDLENFEYNNSFDFECSYTDRYLIYMSFIEGKAGCAVGIMSMLINDSTVFDNRNTTEFLYTGIDNQIMIAYTEEPGCSVVVSSDQGTLSGQSEKYIFRADSLGTVTIKAQTINSIGEVKEEIVKAFKVKELPTPLVSVNGNSGGIITKTELMQFVQLDLIIREIPNTKPYKLLEFSISDKLTGNKTNSSEGNKLSFKQKEMIREFNTGDKLFITNIQVLRPDDVIIELKPLGFIIQ